MKTRLTSLYKSEPFTVIENGIIRSKIESLQQHDDSINIIKTTQLSRQEKAKRNDTNSKIKSKIRYDKTMNVKISDFKIGDKILVKQ